MVEVEPSNVLQIWLPQESTNGKLPIGHWARTLDEPNKIKAITLLIGSPGKLFV
jgi:hypothetical protein